MAKEKRSLKSTQMSTGDVFRRIISPLENVNVGSVGVTQAGYMFAWGLSSVYFSLLMNDILMFAPQSMGMIVSIGLVVGVISSVLGGFLADRYNKKIVLTASLLAYAFSILFFISSRGFLQVSFSKALITASSSLFWPVLNATIASSYDSTNRATAFGTFTSIAYIGSSISTLAGGYMYGYVSSFIPFYLATFVLLGISVYVWQMFPKPPTMLPPPPRLVCKTCGYENPEDSQFCGKCGTPLGEEETMIY